MSSKVVLISKGLGTCVVHIHKSIDTHSHKITQSISQSTIIIVYFRLTFKLDQIRLIFMMHDFLNTTSGLYTNSPVFCEQVVVLLMVEKVQTLGSTPICSLALCPSTGDFLSLDHRLLTHSLSMALFSSPPRIYQIQCRAPPHTCV